MKDSLSAQLKMAFFGIAPNDRHLATRQSAASPRDQRARKYDLAGQLRARIDLARSAANRRTGNNGPAIVTPVPTHFPAHSAPTSEPQDPPAPSESPTEAGLFVDTDVVGVTGPIFPEDSAPVAASASDPATDSETTILPSPLTAPEPIVVFSAERAQTLADRVHHDPRACLGNLPEV